MEEEKREENVQPLKFADFIKTVKPDDHPEMEIPKEAQVTKVVDRVLAIIHEEATGVRIQFEN